MLIGEQIARVRASFTAGILAQLSARIGKRPRRLLKAYVSDSSTNGRFSIESSEAIQENALL